MRQQEVKHVRHGLYIIYWKSGGHSLASVGSSHNGDRWFAPTNWVSGVSFDWGDIMSLERVETRLDKEATEAHLEELTAEAANEK